MASENVILDNDPQKMKDVIGKMIRVETIENQSISGVVFSIDPVSRTVVLVDNNEKGANVSILPSHGIKSMVITSQALAEGFALEADEEATIVDQERKTKVKEWLQKHQMDIVEDGPRLRFEQHLIIEPPYGPEQCLCKNTIVLERVQKLLALMPTV